MGFFEIFKRIQNALYGAFHYTVSMINTEEKTSPPLMPKELLWLADSPLFIDSKQVDGFSTAILGYGYHTESVTLDAGNELTDTVSVGAEGEAGLTLSALAGFLSIVKPEIKVKAEASFENANKSTEASHTVLRPIRTAQRQLVLLAFHYFEKAKDRMFFLNRPFVGSWYDRKTILQVPREIVFIEFPSLLEAEEESIPATKIIPTAAEFANGKIVTYFDKLADDDGNPPPTYPDWKPGITADSLRDKRKDYWKWFDEKFSATRTMLKVEELASNENCRINWMDFRVLLNAEGDSLHLHCVPNGEYDTGVFAYNFIKRGFTHGIRLVGTIRSEPSMNVLAIYDK